jgi:hypothetical protein
VRRKLTERIELPEGAEQLALDRTHDIVRACLLEPTERIIDSIALSCYLQGAYDAVRMVERRPEFMEELKQAGGGG